MNHLYYSKLNIIKNTKVNYYAPNIWRLIYLISSSEVYHTKEKKIYNRSTTLPSLFVGHEILVYSGNKWHKRNVNKWMVGFKAGEFTWNRRYALYKAKRLRKKKKK